MHLSTSKHSNISDVAVRTQAEVLAVLGPTNTGKTYHAIEMMLKHETGVIGFPLRLLARENYERVVSLTNKSQVALITGEEKIIPKNARYYICTVESMPIEKSFNFLAVDEIQLCSDPERGHVFTDRLLRARGRDLTMFLGASTIEALLIKLIPDVLIQTRPRLSELKYTGYKKVTRIPKRSAVVAFSIDEVYEIAELIRRQRGGTAVVLGALSPRARNRQVEMYQSGEVDFMVATDAIGMGLNMDIHHISIAGTRKFDGKIVRSLSNAELAQVAGRAGRYKRDGTFGITAKVPDLDIETVEAIQNHSFQSLEALCWRNNVLDFQSPKMLLKSLNVTSRNMHLKRGRIADDLRSLNDLIEKDDVVVRATSPETTRLLWDVCQIPDFRKTMNEEHSQMISDVYQFLCDNGKVKNDYIESRLQSLDKKEGDVDTLMARLAHIRTWTYITHKSDWTDQGQNWSDQARVIEDNLSDALHDALLKRFVDRRSAVLIQAMDNQSELMAGIKASGEVVVEGHPVGFLKGFRFFPDDMISGSEYYTVQKAARNALKPEIQRRVKYMLNAEDKQFSLDPHGVIFYQSNATNPTPGDAVGKIKKGEGPYKPQIELDKSDFLETQDEAAISKHLQAWLDRLITQTFDSLNGFDALTPETVPSASVRGICYQLFETFGIVERKNLEDLIAGLDEESRKSLREQKVRLGPVLVFMPNLNKPAAIKLKATLWSLWNDQPLPANIPNDGLTSYAIDPKDVDANYQRVIGYPAYGNRAIRVDILDRVISSVYDHAKDGKFQARHEMAEWLGCSIADLYTVLEGLGHKKDFDPNEQAAELEEAAKTQAAPEGDSSEQATTETQPESDDVKADDPVKAEQDDTKEAQAAAGKPAEAAKPDETKPDEVKSDEVKSDEAKPVAKQIKPELATFILRRGKAYGAGNRQKQPYQGKSFKSGNASADKKTKFKKHKGKKPAEQRKTVHSAKAKADDSANPFAVLKDLKVQNKD